MQIELLNTGSELLLGRVLNTHQQWLCRRLADVGFIVSRQVAVPDTGPAIQTAVREALGRADLVITTGGLGPTSDDLTRDLIAALLGLELHMDNTVLARIHDYFVGRKRPQPESTKIQAQIPAGAEVLMNANGTAPGLVLRIAPGTFRPQPSLLIMLPGPPRELRPMFDLQVMPLLRAQFPAAQGYVCRTLKTTGVGESRVEELIAPALKSLVRAGLEIGYCARLGEVDVRLEARGPQAAATVAQAEILIRSRLHQHIFGADDVQLEQVVVRLLTEQGRTLALAESCTGGYIAHRLTNVPGASHVLRAGLVTYANAAKEQFLGVRVETLAAQGAVSEATAREMAQGARERCGVDFALAVTGIAGPGGGTPDKPVGTVFIALATLNEIRVQRQLNVADRESFKNVTSQQALEMLRQVLI